MNVELYLLSGRRKIEIGSYSTTVSYQIAAMRKRVCQKGRYAAKTYHFILEPLKSKTKGSTEYFREIKNK